MRGDFWTSFARKWSMRGRLRTFCLLLALILAQLSWPCIVTGGVFFSFGIALHIFAKGWLVRNQKLCMEGPYGWVRHPFYFSNFLLDTGLFLIAGTPWLALIYVFVFPAAYLPRLLAEEESLKKKFGKEFDSYRNRVPALLPRSLPSPLAWLRGISGTNLLRENEYSRLLRTLAYPLLIAAILAIKLDWVKHSHDLELFALSILALALAVASMGHLINRYSENPSTIHSRRLWAWLSSCWLLLPFLPATDNQFPWLELKTHEPALWTISGLLIFTGSVLLLWRSQANSPRHGLGLTLTMLGCGIFSEQILLAPFLALAVWIGWYLSRATTNTCVSDTPPQRTPRIPTWALRFSAYCFFIAQFFTEWIEHF